MVSLSFHPPAYTGWYEKSQHLRSAVCGDNDAGQQRVFFTSLDNVFLLCRRFAINATHFICFDEQILIDGLQLRHRSRLGRLFDDRARIPFAPNESDWDLVSSRVHRLHSSRMRVIAYLLAPSFEIFSNASRTLVFVLKLRDSVSACPSQ